MTTVAGGPAEMLPSGALKIAGALVLFALAVVTLARVLGMTPAASPEAVRAADHATPLKSRTLRFSDRTDGAVVITDVRTGQSASIIAPGSQSGFIRGVMRGLARDRRTRGLGADAPFVLTAWRDGQLSLTDSATGRELELSGFGATNRAAFAALLQ